MLKIIKQLVLVCFVRFIHPLIIKSQQRWLHYRVMRGGKIRVVFLAMNLGMWRYQRVYERFVKDKRFDVKIVLSPSYQFEKSEQARDIQILRNYFTSYSIPFVDWDFFNEESLLNLRTDIRPDILFYPQQYRSVYYPDHSFVKFLDKLLCLCPYGLATEEENWTYNTGFHNIAWKLFYTNRSELYAARRLAINKGKNVVVTGYPNMTEYLSKDNSHANDVWKVNDRRFKRIIWAPHYSINPHEDELYLSNFLRMADLMLLIADEFKDRILIAFKPHPKLRTKLYAHPDWGVDRTDSYYKQWEESGNTQLETGAFIDLFKTSDAMIHDCDSFQIEYLYLNKPVMFVSNGVDQKGTSLLREEAMKCHYIGRNNDDIRRFVNMVIRGEDIMEEKRQQFFKRYLLPENGTDVAFNIYNEILTALKLE